MALLNSRTLKEELGRFFQNIYSRSEDTKLILNSLNFTCRVPLGESKLSLLDALYLFARLEYAYINLQFLNTRSFFIWKEDNLASWQKLTLGFKAIATTPEKSPENSIAAHMDLFCSTRLQLIGFYRTLFHSPLSIVVNCSSHCESLSELLRTFIFVNNEFSNALSLTFDLIKQEITLLVDLLHSQMAISNLIFLDALLALNRSKEGIEWFHKTLTFEGQNSLNKFPLFSWLSALYNCLLNKYSLYWFDILARAGPGVKHFKEMTPLMDSTLVSSITSFQSSTTALYVSILFDTTCQSYPFLGHGYVVRGCVDEAPKGVESIPPIFTAPMGESLPPVDLYSIVMQISGTLNLGENEELHKLLYLYDGKLNHTYFIQKLECRVFLALIFDGLQPRKDKQTLEFISMLSENVRLQNVVTMLKQHWHLKLS